MFVKEFGGQPGAVDQGRVSGGDGGVGQEKKPFIGSGGRNRTGGGGGWGGGGAELLSALGGEGHNLGKNWGGRKINGDKDGHQGKIGSGGGGGRG
ncbi:hypothetical protein PY38_00150, partial [Staphylococcus aureus]